MRQCSIFRWNRPERFQAKWSPVRVEKTRQIKNLEPRFDSIETAMALGPQAASGSHNPARITPPAFPSTDEACADRRKIAAGASVIASQRVARMRAR